MAKTQRWIQRNERPSLKIDRVPLRFLFFERPKVIFCPIAKNSSTLFKRLLIEQSEYANKVDESGLDIHQFVRSHRDLRIWNFAKMSEPGYLKFAIIRDPLERIVSAYLNKFVSAKRNHRVANLATTGYIELVDSEFPTDRFLNFRQFVRLLCYQADAEMDQHWRPQITFLRDYADAFDWLVPLTRLHDFFPVMEDRLGVSIPREKTKNRIAYSPVETDEDITKWQPQRLRNRGYYPDKDSLLTPDLREALEQRYAGDIALVEKARRRFDEKIRSAKSDSSNLPM